MKKSTLLKNEESFSWSWGELESYLSQFGVPARDTWPRMWCMRYHHNKKIDNDLLYGVIPYIQILTYDNDFYFYPCFPPYQEGTNDIEIALDIYEQEVGFSLPNRCPWRYGPNWDNWDDISIYGDWLEEQGRYAEVEGIRYIVKTKAIPVHRVASKSLLEVIPKEEYFWQERKTRI